MLLTTPTTIRTLQRKLYAKAKQEPAIVTCAAVAHAARDTQSRDTAVTRILAHALA